MGVICETRALRVAVIPAKRARAGIVAAAQETAFRMTASQVSRDIPETKWVSRYGRKSCKYISVKLNDLIDSRVGVAKKRRGE